MSLVGGAALGVRFILELCMLAALAYWGYQSGGSLPGRVALLIIAPLIATIIWGLLIAPRATIHVSSPVRLALEIVIFALAAIGLAISGQLLLGLILAIVYAIDTGLLFLTGKW